MPKPFKESLIERLDREYAGAGGFKEFKRILNSMDSYRSYHIDQAIATRFDVTPVTASRWRNEYKRQSSVDGITR